MKTLLKIFLCWLFLTIKYHTSSPSIVKTIINIPFKNIFRCVEDPYTNKYWIAGTNKNIAKFFTLDLTNTLNIENLYTTTNPEIVTRIELVNDKYMIIAGQNGIYLREKSDPETELGLPPAYQFNYIEAMMYIPQTEFFIACLSILESVFLSSYLTMQEISNKSSPGMPKDINNFYFRTLTDFVCYGSSQPYISAIQYTNMNYIKILVDISSAANVRWIKSGFKKNEFAFISDFSFYSVDFNQGNIVESYTGLTGGNFRLFEMLAGSRIIFMYEKLNPALFCYDLVENGNAQQLWSTFGVKYVENSVIYESFTFCYNSITDTLFMQSDTNFLLIGESGSGLDCSASPNCEKCGYKDNFCIKCNSGFKSKERKCVETCGENFYYDIRLNLCTISPCEAPLNYDGTGSCFNCEENQFFKESDKSCEDCTKKFGTECQKCTEAHCSNCTENFTLSEEKDKCFPDSCPGKNYELISNKCICIEISCCDNSKEYFYKRRCHSIKSIPKYWGLYKSHLGNTIRKCFRKNCEDCKEDYLNCKDKKNFVSKNSFEKFIFELTKFLDNFINFSVPFSYLFSAALSFFGIQHGSSIAASTQKVQIISYLRFINIDYGDWIEIVWENKNPKIREKIDRKGTKIGDKLNRYGVTFIPNIFTKIKLGSYIIAWLIKNINSVLFWFSWLTFSKKKNMWIKEFFEKIWLALFNSFVVELLFFGSRVILFVKFNESWTIYYYIFTIIWFTMLISDILLILKVTFGYKFTEKNFLEKDESISGMKLQINEEKNDKQNFNINNKVVETHLLTHLKKNKVDGLELAKYEKFLNFARCCLFMVLLVSMQQLVPVSIALLFLFELSNLVFFIFLQIKNCSLIWISFVHKIFTHLGMMIFLLVISDYSFSKKIFNNSSQYLIVTLMTVLTIGENIFLGLNVLIGFFIFFKVKFCKKCNKSKNKKKNRIEDLNFGKPDVLATISQKKQFEPTTCKFFANKVKKNDAINSKRRFNGKWSSFYLKNRRRSVKINYSKNSFVNGFKKIRKIRGTINLDKFKSSRRLIVVGNSFKKKKELEKF